MLLKSAGLEKDGYSNRRAIYSLGHTYATFQLQEGVHQHILVLDMGTSTAMLEKHYGHISNVVNAAELTKRTGESKTRKIGAMDWLME